MVDWYPLKLIEEIEGKKLRKHWEKGKEVKEQKRERARWNYMIYLYIYI